MADIEINADRLLQRLNKMSKIDLSDGIKKATTLVHGQAKELAPVKTGTLAGSIHMKVTKNEKEVQGMVYTNLNYAKYVEFGTGIKGNGTYPYKIKGIDLKYNDKGWRYYDEKQEKWIYTTGQVAHPYMYTALRMHGTNIKNIINSSISEQIQKNSK